MKKEWHELTELQKAQVIATFDQRLSDPPEQYTYEIGKDGYILSRKHK